MRLGHFPTRQVIWDTIDQPCKAVPLRASSNVLQHVIGLCLRSIARLPDVAAEEQTILPIAQRHYLTDEQVEQEIERLRNSPYVALARKEQYVRCQRRQALYSLRHLEKKGKSLAASGITMDMLDATMED